MKIRHELSIKGKNGISFLSSAVVIWIIITVIFLLPFELEFKNMLTLFSTGLLFPLSIALSHFMKADWKFDKIPLGTLGLFLNLAQLVYFPILVWALAKNPADMVVFFSIIAGAHFYPYGWFYAAKPYYFMAPFMAIVVMVVGWTLEPKELWLVPAAMVLMLIVLILLLYLDWKRKVA